MNKKLIVTLMLTISTAALAGEHKWKPRPNRDAGDQKLSVDKHRVKVNLSPIVELEQPLPTLRKQTDTPLEVNGGFDDELSVSIPGVKVGLGVGQLTLGPDTVKVGRVTGVKVGSWSLTQRLPGIAVGTDVNKDKFIDIGLKGGLSLTLPFIKLSVPWPNCTTK
jgi:hypothetical protein